MGSSTELQITDYKLQIINYKINYPEGHSFGEILTYFATAPYRGVFIYTTKY